MLAKSLLAPGTLNNARNFLPSRDSNVTKLPEMSALKL